MLKTKIVAFLGLALTLSSLLLGSRTLGYQRAASSPQPTARRPIPCPRWILAVIRQPSPRERSRRALRSRSPDKL